MWSSMLTRIRSSARHGDLPWPRSAVAPDCRHGRTPAAVVRGPPSGGPWPAARLLARRSPAGPWPVAAHRLHPHLRALVDTTSRPRRAVPPGRTTVSILANHSALVEILEHQHGVVHWRQALASGLTERALGHRVHGGLLIPEFPDVYRLAGVPRSIKGQVMAACLSTDGLASHVTSTMLWLAAADSSPRLRVRDRGRRTAGGSGRSRLSRASAGARVSEPTMARQHRVVRSRSGSTSRDHSSRLDRSRVHLVAPDPPSVLARRHGGQSPQAHARPPSSHRTARVERPPASASARRSGVGGEARRGPHRHPTELRA